MILVHDVSVPRIELAFQHLIQANLPVASICHEVGFRNVADLNQQFLSVQARPSSRFRSLQRAGPDFAAAA